MDRTLLPLLLLSVVLVAVLAPHATLTLTAIVTLSAIATRGSWAIIQAFEQSTPPRKALD